MIKWKRPDNIPFPQVWWRFSAKDPDTGDTVDYRIEDLTEDRYEEVVDLMIKYFIPDEPICICLDNANDAAFVAESREIWAQAVARKFTLVCYKENSREICGFNMLQVLRKSEDVFQVQIKRPAYIIFQFMKKKIDLYNRYNVDQFLGEAGLLTIPKYRGCGIATELLKARIPVMKALGVTLTSSLFTAPGSQAAAKKAGYTEDLVLTYESLGKDEPFLEFPNISHPIVKFMSYELK